MYVVSSSNSQNSRRRRSKRYGSMNIFFTYFLFLNALAMQDKIVSPDIFIFSFAAFISLSMNNDLSIALDCALIILLINKFFFEELKGQLLSFKFSSSTTKYLNRTELLSLVFLDSCSSCTLDQMSPIGIRSTFLVLDNLSHNSKSPTIHFPEKPLHSMKTSLRMIQDVGAL